MADTVDPRAGTLALEVPDAFDDLFALIHHAVAYEPSGDGRCSLQHRPAESAGAAGLRGSCRPDTADAATLRFSDLR
jgi:hypothetical protein